jgi:CheY-like chemotaxis protein
VLTASDGIEAIALYVQHRHQISTVLVDLIMPSMDGFTTIGRCKNLTLKSKFIAMSGLASNAQ